jgi:hypothetical protein
MEAEHKFEKSMPYNSEKGCPKKYHKRSGYTTSTGKYVPPRCVRSTTPYPESSAEFKRNVTRKMKARIEHVKKTKNTKCPAGYIPRAPYVRRYTTSVRQKGYTVKKASGTTYTVKPKAESFYVPAACIKDRGEVGKGSPSGQGIGVLRKGELTKHGYSIKASTEERHSALKKAVAEYGDLNVYRKLDAVAKLSVKIAPQASVIFKADREWLKKTYAPLTAF